MQFEGKTSVYFEKSVRLDDGKPINWDDYHYRDLIDSNSIKRLVLRTSRQVGKSIFNVMQCLKFAHIPMFRTIYMAPSQKQAEEFSKLKLGKILNINSEVKRLLLSNKSPIAAVSDMKAVSILNDVYIKSYATAASLKIGYAADEIGVEKVRGGSADALIKDESQSMLLDIIDDVLDPMLDSSDYRINVNTGTPLDPEDDLCKLFDTTSQHTMVVKCHHCGKYTTLNHLKQISVKGVLCFHCMKPVDIRTGDLVPMNPSSNILGIHLNKLMMPGVVFNPTKWQDLLDKVLKPNANEDKLYAEQLGIPKGSFSTFITKKDVEACKDPTLTYDPDNDYEKIIKNIRLMPDQHLVVGIDWGGGANDQAGGDLPGKSHSTFVLMAFRMEYDKLKIRVLYHKLYPLPNVKKGIEDIIEKIRMLPPKTLVSMDYMGGSYGNSSIFEIADRQQGVGIRSLPVRFTSMIDLLAHRKEQYRVDVDRNFIISQFLKKKVLEKKLELCSNDRAFDELSDSFRSMKNLTPRQNPGVTLWVLRSARTNDLMMGMIAGWVGFCVDKGLYRDIMM